MVTGRNKTVVVNSVTGYGSPKCANTGTALNPLVIAHLVHSRCHINFPKTFLLTLLLVVVLPSSGRANISTHARNRGALITKSPTVGKKTNKN